MDWPWTIVVAPMSRSLSHENRKEPSALIRSSTAASPERVRLQQGRDNADDPPAIRAQPAVVPNRRRFRTLLARTAVAGVSALVTLLLVEVGLRVTGFEFPLPSMRHPDRGIAYVPDMKWHQSLEGAAQIRTNSLGFRDEEWSVDGPENGFRIAVLGDSFVAAVEVDDDERFTELMAERLADAAVFDGRSIEVMNFGVGGYGTAQELIVWRNEVRQFAPDMVILAVCTANDIVNNSASLQGAHKRPFFDLQNGRLVLDNSFRDRSVPLWRQAGRSIARWSRVGQLGYQVFHASRTRSATERASLDPLQQRLSQAGLTQAWWTTPEVHVEPSNPDWQRAWKVTAALMGRMQEEVETSGADFRVVVLSNGIQVHPDADRRRTYARIIGADDLFYPDRRIQSVCALADIPVLALAPAMQARVEDSGEYLHGFENTTLGLGHWNEAGHAVAAGLISEWITGANER